MNIFIIGAGGVSSYLVPCLKKLANLETITIIDGDVLEDRNLDRQLFSPRYIGQNKAVALSEMHGTKAIPYYLTEEMNLHPKEEDFFIVCVDNHKARRVALDICDKARCWCIIGANEYTDSEAYIYQGYYWKGGSRDPRIRCPEIVTDNSNNPVSCQGEILDHSPQLCIANMLAASYILHLFYNWFSTGALCEFENLPVWHRSNLFKINTLTISDIDKIYE